ncbi:SMI1 / KNR4 family (SUKH-1) [Pseudomonas congelans]|uniref:SMI1 / KNR4 family (SUKH-1) n=1 Tax=Pseudomonas congelans TaxID=200452 RepID=A0A1H0QNW9_9PSED|nr:SMI1/KNR4 family protein [Pseudomonas congelans]SDP19024.1 SMI1 / KNR4 family (SUKH-1) [Pseudomonas congelans]
MPVIHREGLQQADVELLASEMGRVLPADYKRFLMRMNGFYIGAPDYVILPLSAADDVIISFDRFFGWLPDESCNDIVAFNQEFSGELDFLPQAITIGEDGGGNPYVILQGSEEVAAGVYYWDRTHLHASDELKSPCIAEINECGNLFFMASDFFQFYDKIISVMKGAPQFIEEA